MTGKSGGGKVRDWTKKTIVIDLENSLGEKFHFEIKPGEKDNLPARPSSSPITTGGAVINLIMPL